jgi:hypothetical protein
MRSAGRRLTNYLRRRYCRPRLPRAVWGRPPNCAAAFGPRSSPTKRIFLSSVQDYFGAFHRGDGCCADRRRCVDVAACRCGADCLRLPCLHARHHAARRSRRTMRQHHLLRVWDRRLLRFVRFTAGTADVLWLTPEIPAQMVPITSDGGSQGRELRLPHVHELRRAGARRAIPGLHSAERSIFLDARRHLIWMPGSVDALRYVVIRATLRSHSSRASPESYATRFGLAILCRE